MDFGNICFSMKPQQIHYSECRLEELVIREVYDGDYPKGIYHVKPVKNINLKFLVDFLRKNIHIAKVDLTDPSGDLELEYPIYMTTQNPREDMIISIGQAHDNLCEFIKNRQKGGI